MKKIVAILVAVFSFGTTSCGESFAPPSGGVTVNVNGGEPAKVCKTDEDCIPGTCGPAGLCIGVKGADGKDGTTGPQGPAGKDGVDGKDGVSCTVVTDAQGCAVVACGTVEFPPICPGKDGVPGEPGKDGADGESCTGVQDKHAAGCVVVTCGHTTFASICPGKDGVDGADGKDGLPGKDGVDGVDAPKGSECGPHGECDDDNPCTIDSCDMATGYCSFSLLSWMLNCVSCVVDADCKKGDVCQTPSPGESKGICIPFAECEVTADCDDGNKCTDDSCNIAAGECEYAPVACDDKNPDTTDTCDPAKGCVYAAIAACDDKNPCTLDGKDPQGLCLNPPLTGWECEDGDPCTKDDECKGGVCESGPKDLVCAPPACTPASCDDKNANTTDTCDPVKGCAHTPKAECAVAADCNDNKPCTVDSCTSGKCVHAASISVECVDQDGDGYTVAAGDCDDDPNKGGAPAVVCKDAAGKNMLVVNWDGTYSQYPTCPTGTEVRKTDGSFLNNPAMHDTPGDLFDNNCNGKVDEVGTEDKCSWAAVPGHDGWTNVVCPFMNPSATP